MLHKSSLSRISLGRMLLLAFLVIAGLPTATGILGWVELQKVARNQTKAINETIPAISEVRGFTEESSRIVAVAPELAAVTTEGARRERAAYLYAQVDALSERVSRYERTGNVAPLVGEGGTRRLVAGELLGRRRRADQDRAEAVLADAPGEAEEGEHEDRRQHHQLEVEDQHAGACRERQLQHQLAGLLA